MTDDAEMNEALQEWKAEMQAEHAEAIENPDPEAKHRIEGVTQVNYRVAFEYDAEAGKLRRSETEQVDDLSDPDLLSCSCGVRGMTRAEARSHIEAAGEQV